MKEYRIYTERRENIRAIVSKYFHGATVFDAVGLWQGNAEDSSVIEVLTADATAVGRLARELQMVNGQDAVLVTSKPVEVEWALNQGGEDAPTTGPLGDLPEVRPVESR